jgi:hypothetical protein
VNKEQRKERNQTSNYREKVAVAGEQASAQDANRFTGWLAQCQCIVGSSWTCRGTGALGGGINMQQVTKN